MTKVMRLLRARPPEELQRAGRSLHATLRGRPSPGVLRPLLIGQAPGPHTHPDLPLFPEPRTSAGGRLLALTGLSHNEYMARFDRVNLLYHYFGKHANDVDKFPQAQARAAAEAMRSFLVGREVLLVGRDVATAFGHADTPWLEWHTDPWEFRFAVLPHPSGRNHWYNCSENKLAASNFMRAWVSNSVAFCDTTTDDAALNRNGDADGNESLTEDRHRDPADLQ